MKKIIFGLILVLLVPSVLMAQEKRADMRDLAVNNLFEYGRQVFNRGDLASAKQIFLRLQQLNPDYAPALPFAKKLGIPQFNMTTQVIKVTKTVTAEVTAVPVVIDPNADLKNELAMEDKAIAQLNSDINNLRSTLETTSHE